MQRLLAIVLLTVKAAFRYRLVVALAVALLGIVVGLPMVVKHDGTARGLVQIILTYTLGTITTLLALSTLWLACGTLAREVEECQLQVVAVKPVARWQIWLGKWLGILALNAVLLALSGGAVFVLLQLKARELKPEELKILRSEVLVARGSVKEPVPDYKAKFEEAFEARARAAKLNEAERRQLRQYLEEREKYQYQLVQPGFLRRWRLEMGSLKDRLRDQPMQIRIKFHTPRSVEMVEPSEAGTFVADLRVGKPETTLQQRLEPMSLAAGTFHEIRIPPNCIDDDGILWVEFQNWNDVPLLFSLEDGMEVLYPEAGFGLNFIRGVAIIFCWLALLAALGLCASSELSFPVAAFVCLGVLFIGMASGTFATVVEEGSYMGIDWNENVPYHPAIDAVVVPIIRAFLGLVNLVQGFSPIDSLSSGRSVSWGQLARAVGQIVLLMGGLLAAVGIAVFTRRELARGETQG